FSSRELEKTVCFLHGSEPEFIYQNNNIQKRLLNLRFFFHRALIKCSFIGAHSEFMKEKFLKNLPKKLTINSDKIIPLYFGYDASLFNTDNKIENKNTIRNKYKIKESDILLLTVSRVEEKKGFVKMLNTFEIMKSMNENLKWMIVGDGGFLESLKEIAFRKGIFDSLIIVGKIPRSELCMFYNSADIFWLLSEYQEAFGLVYIESQACGVPAIGYNNSGVREAVVDGVTGYLINNLDEMLDIVVTKKFQIITNESLYDFSKKFDSKQCYLKILKAFNEKVINE
ncbi:TPA: glycosyltransferase family 4 protein, partial [Escherichia coli]|nr:glycosyltransferase family 4 protein [Escherichia coli]